MIMPILITAYTLFIKYLLIMLNAQVKASIIAEYQVVY